MGRESLPVPGRKGGHAGGFRVSLMLEENRKVGFDYVAKDSHYRQHKERT